MLHKKFLHSGTVFAYGLKPMMNALMRRQLGVLGAQWVTDDAALICGDAIAALRMLPTGSADLIFADPPYGLSDGGTTVQSGKRVVVDKGTWDVWPTLGHFHHFNREWLRACQRVLKPSGTIWVSGTRHAIFSIGYAMQDLGFNILNTISWFKPNAPPNLGCRTITESCEYVIWAAPREVKPLAHVFNYKAMRKVAGNKQLRDMWEIPPPGPKEKRHGKHPTQKPLALLERIIAASSLPDDVVIDPFCGSGTTGVAALKSNRRFIGIDMEPGYIALSKARMLA